MNSRIKRNQIRPLAAADFMNNFIIVVENMDDTNEIVEEVAHCERFTRIDRAFVAEFGVNRIVCVVFPEEPWMNGAEAGIGGDG
ncbi:MAG: hypothetical protein HQL50_10220 [Magnetococcales bacterium]|nr:hypothetical protein [Magnetococcales bacterium]